MSDETRDKLEGFMTWVAAGEQPGTDRDWLCPVHQTPGDAALQERLMHAIQDQVNEELQQDRMPTLRDLVADMSHQAEIVAGTLADRAELTGEEREQFCADKRVELMFCWATFSLGYWMDALVLEDVQAKTGATPDQIMDVVMFREATRRGGILAHGLDADGGDEGEAAHAHAGAE